MKLLIVDDQPATLKGLQKGVDWASMGINTISICENAMQARISIKEKIPDIILCDIEMPVENGIELCKWMREQNYSTQVIFLTCHSEFTYAKEAVTIGAVDYILQPAPYNKVREAVQKAIHIIKTNQDTSKTLDKAETYIEQKDIFIQSLWRSFLQGIIEEDAVKNIEDLPAKSFEGYLILLQIVRWNASVSNWEPALLTAALNSFIADVFPQEKFIAYTTFMSPNVYSIFLNTPSNDLQKNDLVQQLSYFCNIYDMYMPCAVACYLAEKSTVSELPMKWKELVSQQYANVTSKKGVFSSPIAVRPSGSYVSNKIQHWKEYLSLNQGETMEAEAFELLDSMDKNGELNITSLMSFYQEFIKMLYSVNSDSGRDLHDLFDSQEKIEMYSNAMKSLSEMKNLVHYIASSFNEHSPLRSQKETVQIIEEYINSNLDSNIRKEDIVNLVHLNTDYITKLFKSEKGISIKGYIIQQKLMAAQNLLKNTSLSISYIAARYGYSNFSHFSSAYKKQFGIPPQDERKKPLP